MPAIVTVTGEGRFNPQHAGNNASPAIMMRGAIRLLIVCAMGLSFGSYSMLFLVGQVQLP